MMLAPNAVVPAVSLSDLKPYISAMLAKFSAPLSGASVAAYVDALMAHFVSAVGNGRGRTTITPGVPSVASAVRGLQVSAWQFVRYTKVNWTTSNLQNIENHLLLVLAANDFVAIHSTDEKTREDISNQLRLGVSITGHPNLFRVSEQLIAEHLVQGNTSTIWLSGTHGTTPLKASSKILAGPNIEYALDPLEDQSFCFRAARCRHPFLAKLLGVAPENGRIWIGPAPDINEFANVINDIFAELRKATSGRVPYPQLAQRVRVVANNQVFGAFEFSLIPPDLLNYVPSSVAANAGLPGIIDNTTFRVVSHAGSDLQVEAVVGGTSVGGFNVAVNILIDGAADISVISPIRYGIKDQDFDAILTYCSERSLINIRYDSSHSVADCKLFQINFRSVPFEGFIGKPGLSGAMPEKPPTPAVIGGGGSIFCWVLNNFRSGWLMCDDGALEKADFIHIDTANNAVTIIHAKAGQSMAQNVSVSAYEIVVSQAVKNLQWIDKSQLSTAITSSTRVSTRYWNNGVLQLDPRGLNDSSGFIVAASGLASNYSKKVLIIQPDLSVTTRSAVMSGQPGSANHRRLDQLHTLLASAESTCRGLGAEFKVFCSL